MYINTDVIGHVQMYLRGMFTETLEAVYRHASWYAYWRLPSKRGGYKIEEAKSKKSLWRNFCDVAFAEITDLRLLALVYDILPQASAITCYAKGLPKLSAMDLHIQVHAVS